MYRELKNLAESELYPFHMPGHKRNSWKGELQDALRLDITEIDGFDNLHHPEGLILQLEERLQGVFGGDRARLLVNGSTTGILAAVSAAVPRGARFLMSRNSHISAYHAAEINGLCMSYLWPETVQGWGFSGGIRPQAVEEALIREPDIRAVLITSPTYEGMVSDVERISKVCRKHGVPLIVDSAHGAHLGLYPPFTEKFHCPDACAAGADIAIESLHKTLPAFTQTALALCRGNAVDPGRFSHFLSLFQTSSPSYVFMAGADLCLDFLETEGQEAFARLDRSLGELRSAVSGLKSIGTVGAELMGSWGIAGIDPTKILLRKAGMTGKELYDVLRNEFRLQPEMASGGYCLLMTSVMDREEGFRRLQEALFLLDRREAEGEQPSGRPSLPEIPVCRMTISEAVNAPSEKIPLCEAAGRTAAGFVYAYPPGIPLIVPGEVLTEELTERLPDMENKGLKLQGMEEGQIPCVF